MKSFKRFLLGLALILSAIVGLLTALQRSELALLLWSVFFLGLCACMALTHFAGGFFLAQAAKNAQVGISAAVAAGRPFSVAVRFFKKPKKLFFIQYSLEASFYFPTRPQQNFSRPINSSLQQTFSFTLPFRGNYAQSYALAAKDMFGFFTAVAPLPAMRHLAVSLPYNAEKKEMQAATAGLGSGLHRALPRQQELFDQRKYYPGDDIRRINWKLFGRFNELFIRKAENSAQHSGRAELYLFCPPYNQEAPDLLDKMIAAAYQAAALFEESGSQIRLFAGEQEIEPFSPSQQSCREALSALKAGDLANFVLSRRTDSAALLFFGSAGDLVFIDALHKFSAMEPLVFIASGDSAAQSAENLLFAAKALGLEALLV